MDYGGFNSLFHSNAVYVTNGWNCVNVAGQYAGHEDVIFDNDCVITTQERVDDLFDNCREKPPMSSVRGSNNRFYTPLANATVTCDCCGKITLAELAAISPLTEANATSLPLPSVDTLVAWARAKTGLA